MKRDTELQHRIIAAVRGVEAVSAAEVVVTLTPRTVPATVPVLVTAVVCGVILLVLHPLLFADASSLAVATDTLAVSSLAALLVGSLPPLQRLFFSRERLQHSALAAARAEFVRQGVHTTRRRTGMLLFLSVFERRSLLLVDIGIAALLPPPVLDELERLAASILESSGSDAALDAFFEKLCRDAGTYLPREADDSNELADGLRSV